MGDKSAGIARRRLEAMGTHMRWGGVAGVIVLLTVVLAGQPRVAAALPRPSTTWAVLIEHNAFHGRYPDLPVAYANSTRMLNALVRRGVPASQILLLRDSSDRGSLQNATDWLAARVRPEDVALLYVAGEYQFYQRDLMWDAALPEGWRRIPTAHRVLIVETCYAERLTDAVKGIPGIALPAVGRDELNWWGLRETDRLIRGGTFTYFLSRALESEPASAPPDFGRAFSSALTGAQDYFRNVIATTPGALDPFHRQGSYPERLATFPNPHLIGDTAEPAAASPAPSTP